MLCHDLLTLTGRANSVGVFIFGTEHSLLHHTQEYDSCYPELDPQQILPIAGCPDKPQHGVQDVHDAHHHVELQTDNRGLVYKHVTHGSNCSSLAGDQIPEKWTVQ